MDILGVAPRLRRLVGLTPYPLGRPRVLDMWQGQTREVEGFTFFIDKGRAISARPPTFGPSLKAYDYDRWVTAVNRLRDDGITVQPPISGAWSQSGEELLDAIITNGTQISNTVTETIVCPDFNVPAYYMAAGRVLQVRAWGVCSNVVTTPGNLIFRVRWGGVAGTALLISAAIALDTTARTNALWSLAAIIVCRTTGATGTFNSNGWASVVNVLASVGVANNGVFGAFVSHLGSAGAPIASGNADVTVDTTTAKLLSVSAQFSVATSPTNLTCHGRLIEVLN